MSPKEHIFGTFCWTNAHLWTIKIVHQNTLQTKCGKGPQAKPPCRCRTSKMYPRLLAHLYIYGAGCARPLWEGWISEISHAGFEATVIRNYGPHHWFLRFCECMWLLVTQGQKVNAPGYHFVDFCSLGGKVSKSMLLVMISSTSGANARKLPNRCSWLSICRLLEPRPESHQIDSPGYHFVDFWSQGGKVFKSMLLAVISLTSGANARKLPNRLSGLSSWFSVYIPSEMLIESLRK